jgi:ectoine hydroxylase-related dioxygenase (phytanoyl-CoA dioxygenase family)
MQWLDEPVTLPADARALFERNGHVTLRGLLPTAELAAVGREITRLTLLLNSERRALAERDTYGRAFLQVMNLWEKSPLVGRFVMGQRLARAAAELLGVRGVRLYHDQSLYKEPGGGHTPAHADQYYWPLAGDRTVTAWIPLQDVPMAMGPLGFYSGSHRVAEGRDLGISDASEDDIPARMAALGHPYDCTPFALGDVSFHFGWTFHRAEPNVSDRARSVMTVIYMADDTRLLDAFNPVQANDGRQWCPGVAPGARVDSPKNPVIWSAP